MILISNDINALIHLLSLCSSTVILHVRTRVMSQNIIYLFPGPSLLGSQVLRVLLLWNTLVTAVLKWWDFFPLKRREINFSSAPAKRKIEKTEVLVLRKPTIFQSIKVTFQATLYIIK